MSRTSKTLGFSVPPALVKEVETLARQERRTKSELFREMVRVYRRFRSERDREETRWLTNLIREGRADAEQTPMSADDILAESGRLARQGANRAKKLGVGTDSRTVNTIIHERRKAKSSAEGSPRY